MPLVFGALFDPASDRVNLGSGQHLVEIRRWHVFIGILSEEAFHDLTLFWVPGDDGWLLGFAAFDRCFK